MRTVAHITHEAIQKIGGIGAVLQGLLTARSYAQNVPRTLLIGPLFDTGTDGDARLGAGGEVLYSSLDGIRRTPHADALQAIESAYSVAIVYGRRRFENRNTGITANPEVILIEVSNINPERNNSFKYALYEQFGIESNRYQEIWEYEQYIRLAEPGYDALCTLTAEDADDECFIIAHELWECLSH